VSSGYRLAIDYGAADTAAATVGPDGVATALDVGGRATVPSVLVVSRGVLVAGRAAADAVAARPEGAIRTTKRKLGTPDPIVRVPREAMPEDGAAATLSLVVREALDQHGGRPPAEVVLAVPVDATEASASALDASLRIAGVSPDVPIRHVPDDIAAASRLAAALPDGAIVAVLDVGVRLTASVLRRTPDGYTRVGEPLVRDELGGDRVDELLTGHLLGRLEPSLAASLREPQSPGDSAARAAFDNAVREAKAQASVDRAGAVIASPSPGGTPVPLSRLALETVVSPLLLEVVDALETAVRGSGIGTAAVELVCLTGASSALPRLDDLVADRFGRVASEAGRRKLAVALGAAGGIGPAPAAARADTQPAVVDAPPLPAAPAASTPVPPPQAWSGGGSAVTPTRPRDAGLAGSGSAAGSGAPAATQPATRNDGIDPATHGSGSVRFLPAALLIGGGLLGLLTLVVDWWTQHAYGMPAPVTLVTQYWRPFDDFLYRFLAIAYAGVALIAIGVAWAIRGKASRPGVPVALAAAAALVITPIVFMADFMDALMFLGPAPVIAILAGLAACVGAGIAAGWTKLGRRGPAVAVAGGGLAGLVAAGLPMIATDVYGQFAAEELLGTIPLVCFLASCVLVAAGGAMAAKGQVRMAGRGIALGASAVLLLGLAYTLFNLATSHTAASTGARPDVGLFLFLVAAALGFAGGVVDIVVAGPRANPGPAQATAKPQAPTPGPRW
jgi:hypothetical protein